MGCVLVKLFYKNIWAGTNSILYLHPLWAISSAGSEHLVYTQGVGGSNPSSPTTLKPNTKVFGFFIS